MSKILLADATQILQGQYCELVPPCYNIVENIYKNRESVRMELKARQVQNRGEENQSDADH